MALQAGTIQITVEFAKDLKDRDWFGKQDPYCILALGSQKVRSRTHIDGGKNPVWNQTFNFQVINDNTIYIAIYDEDTLSNDDLIGTCNISLAKVREQGRDRIQAPIITTHNKQRGFLSLSLVFTSNNSLKPQAAPQYPGAQPYPQPAPGYPPQAPAYPQPGYPPQPYPSAQQQYPPQPYPSAQFAPQPYPSGQHPPQPYPSGQYPPPQAPPPVSVSVHYAPPPYPQAAPQQRPPPGQYAPQGYPGQAPQPYNQYPPYGQR